MFSVTVNVYTAIQTGCTVNPITPIKGNSLFDVNIGLIMQWHFVGLDKVNTDTLEVPQCSHPRHPCDPPQSDSPGDLLLVCISHQ